MESNVNGQPGFQQQQPYFQPPKTNGKSIATLVLGILSIVIPYIGFIIGILAIIFGNLSLKEIKRNGEQGRGLSIAGLVCGIIGTVFWVIVVAVLIIVFVFAINSGDSYNYNSSNYSFG